MDYSIRIVIDIHQTKARGLNLEETITYVNVGK